MTIRPQPGPQTEILASPADIGVFGGAAFAGKTWGLLLEGTRDLNVAGFGATYFRRTRPELIQEGGGWDQSEKLFYPLGGTPNKSELTWYFDTPQGGVSTFSFNTLQHDKDIERWRTSQLPRILIDEGTTFTEKQIWGLWSRCRTDIAVSPYMRLSCNPDPDHFLATFLEWWIDQNTGWAIPERSGVLRWFVRESDSIHWGEPEYLRKHFGLDPISVTFVPGSISDNPIGTARDPHYEGRLQSLPFVEKMRLYGSDPKSGGNWKVRAALGMVKREWLISNIREAAPPDTRWVRYWDTAATGENEPGAEHAAYTCGVLIGIDPWRRIWIGDVIRRRVAGKDRADLIRGTADLDRHVYGHVTQWKEQEPGGGGKTEARDFVILLIGHDARTERVTGDKVVRAGPFCRQIEAGNVYLVRGNWNLSYINELEAFPMSRLKDQMDASSGGFDKLLDFSSTGGDDNTLEPPRMAVDEIDPMAFQ